MESFSPARKARQILIWLGAAEQHLVTRVNRLLRDSGLPLAQFVILNHLASLPAEPWSVTRLASVLDTGQPGVSKILARLVAKGYVAVEADPADRRLKRHALTEAGRAAHRDAFRRVAPLAEALFTDWDEAQIDALHALLYRLKVGLRGRPGA
jgi:DNA-binding MarR family transcriptional regulator